MENPSASEQGQNSANVFSEPTAILQRYLATREATVHICKKLEKEDCIVQPSSEVSPPKWHLAHTTWFFEELILKKFLKDYSCFNDKYSLLFNSYYKSVGEHWLQGERGHLSRPTVDEVFRYREYVDKNMTELLQSSVVIDELEKILEVGIHHEQQHQELLYMDIKYILGVNPCLPAYEEKNFSEDNQTKQAWVPFMEGVYEIGNNGSYFAYDNEGPRHKTYLQPFAISSTSATNADYLDFIKAEGYSCPEYWLSQGWDWVNSPEAKKPLYWFKKEGNWYEYTLYGSQPLQLQNPVTHINYFEASAFAKWKGLRLPTEQESEVFLQNTEEEDCREEISLHPTNKSSICQNWWWTSSHYSPYPRFESFQGVLGEYNGKFMCGQFVLKGGCALTPVGHYRHSYRNFYLPHQKWMFSGIRLAKDI